MENAGFRKIVSGPPPSPRDSEWGYRQFAIADPDGHHLHLFRFLD